MINIRIYLFAILSTLALLFLPCLTFASFRLFYKRTGSEEFGGYTYNKLYCNKPANAQVDTIIHWPSPNITYRINSSGTTDIAGEGEFDAIEAAFHEWENVSPATINFTRGSNTTHTLKASDGQNVLFWSTSEDLRDLQSSRGVTSQIAFMAPCKCRLAEGPMSLSELQRLIEGHLKE